MRLIAIFHKMNLSGTGKAIFAYFQILVLDIYEIKVLVIEGGGVFKIDSLDERKILVKEKEIII